MTTVRPVPPAVLFCVESWEDGRHWAVRYNERLVPDPDDPIELRRLSSFGRAETALECCRLNAASLVRKCVANGWSCKVMVQHPDSTLPLDLPF
jgi:hypothetical protein